jgi:hypothetical protein
MWWSFGFERHNIFLINNMLFSLPYWLAANAAGIADSLIVIALLGDNVLGRRWHFLQTTSTLSSAAEVLQTFSNSRRFIS